VSTGENLLLKVEKTGQKGVGDDVEEKLRLE